MGIAAGLGAHLFSCLNENACDTHAASGRHIQLNRKGISHGPPGLVRFRLPLDKSSRLPLNSVAIRSYIRICSIYSTCDNQIRVHLTLDRSIVIPISTCQCFASRPLSVMAPLRGTIYAIWWLVPNETSCMVALRQ